MLSKTSNEVVNQAEQVTTAQLATDTIADMDSETQPVLDNVSLDNSSRLPGARTTASRHVERFVAAFRGREMYGQAVDIPSGYGGLVLRTPLDSKGKGRENAASRPLSRKAKSKSKTRTGTRRAKRTTEDSTADEPEGGDDGDCCPDSDIDPPPPGRKLVPSSTFTSFMLWTPDRPLDEGRDEYVRALVEWTRLATEVSFLQCLFSLVFATFLFRRYIRTTDKDDLETLGERNIHFLSLVADPLIFTQY